MQRTPILLLLAIAGICSPSITRCSFPPDIRIAFEGWSADSQRFALRKTVVDTGEDRVAEDLLYVVDLSSSAIKIKKKQEYGPRALEGLSLVKADSVRSNNAGTRTFIIGPSEYVYVDYATVIEGVEDGTPSYTIHRRIWILDNGMTRMVFKEDESFSKVSTMREAATAAFLSPDGMKLLILFDMRSHYERKGFVVLDLSQSRIVEKKIRVLE